MTDIFNPQISRLVGGIEGKSILIYGTNRTGKTYNAVRGKKPLVVAFEKGLNAIDGIPFVPINKWNDWTSTVQQLTGPTMDKAKEMYQTVIIDTFDSMGALGGEAICARFNCDTVGSGNKGFGYWKEYADEISKWLRMLTNAGYTTVFIGHDGTRDLFNEQGEKIEQIYPRGDKRVVAPILDLCDFICFAAPQPVDADGNVVKSTLYLAGCPAFHAGSRFPITPVIPEWSMEKLEKAITEAVQQIETQTGVKAVTFTENQTTIQEATKSPWADKPFEEVRTLCLEKAGKLMEANNGDPAKYQELLIAEISTRDFTLSKATERQRDVVEQLLNALIKMGY